MRWWRPTSDLSDEIEHFYEEAVAEWVRQGLSVEEARRRARVQFGSHTAVREHVRERGWEHLAETLVADVIHSIRRLRRDPAFTSVALLTLALGIGAATAIFSVVHPVLFAPLPYPEPHRVAAIWDTAYDDTRLDVTFGTYREIATRTRSFEALAVTRAWQPTLTGPVEPERLEGQRVSAAYFQVLGIRPLFGRTFEQAEDRPNARRVAVLSYGLWQRRFAGDPTIVGRAILLDDLEFTVTGVMPRSFENVLAPRAEIWTTLQYDAALPADGREWGHHLKMVVRLAPGVSAEDAARELHAVAAAPIGEFARPVWASLARGLMLIPVQDDITRTVKPVMMAVAGAALLLLSVACVNVSNLLLARGAARRGELAMRAALGASRRRLLRQLVTESVVLSAFGGVLGVAFAGASVGVLVDLSPAALPRVNAIEINGAVLLAAIAVTLGAAALIGVLPALDASRDLQGGIQSASLRLTSSRQFTRRTLVVVEVALALVLLAGAGLLLRSVRLVLAIPTGFDRSSRLVMQVQTAGRRLLEDEAIDLFFAQALDAVRRVPGVRSAAFTSQLPLTGDDDRYGLTFTAGSYDNRESGAFRYAVTPGYFTTMRLPILQGRAIDDRDTRQAPPVAVISESVARRKFGDRDPLGQQLHVGDPNQPAYTIVGVAGNVTQTSLATDSFDAVYVPASQWAYTDRALWLVVHTRGDPTALGPQIKNAVWSIDKDQPIARLTTMDDIVRASEAGRRFAMQLFEAFAGVALFLAAIGLYGVLFASVTERTREISVRAALGASRATIVINIMRDGMTVTAAGVVIGFATAVAISDGIVALLFGVTPVDAITYIVVIGMLFIVAVVACAIPAWRAVSIDPVQTLRMG